MFLPVSDNAEAPPGEGAADIPASTIVVAHFIGG
jgi:hypothetical protein